MDAENKKIVAFSFFDQTPDYFEIKDQLKLKHTSDLTKAEHTEATDKLWRPSTAFALAMQDDPKGGLIDEYHLFYQPSHRSYGKVQKMGAEWIKNAIERLSDGTRVNLEAIDIGDGHDFETVYLRLKAFLKKHQVFFKDRENTRYFVNVTAGTHVAQMCLFLLTQERLIPAEVVQVYRDVRNKRDVYRGKCNITNIVLTSEAYKDSRIHKEQVDEALKNQEGLKGQITTYNTAYNNMIEEIERVALRTNEPILILGPTGAGKTRLAELIYEMKKRHKQLINPQNGEFVSINCAALTENLVESELFGHVKGSFTGAIADHKGCLERANGGILFLDEIGCLPPTTQGKLLKALDSGEFTPLGGEEKCESKFQLICGTNEDLQTRAHTRGGGFRLDLLERIRTWTYVLPGLADRREDIDPNIDEILNKYYKDTNNKRSFDREARDKFLKYAYTIPFEGNFRELKRMVTRLATLSDDRITSELVEEEIARHKKETESRSATASTSSSAENQASFENNLLTSLLGKGYESKIDLIDLAQLRCAVEVCCREGVKNQADAARKLYAYTKEQNKRFNASGYMKTLFNQKAFKPFGLTFSRIREAFAAVKEKAKPT